MFGLVFAHSSPGIAEPQKVQFNSVNKMLGSKGLCTKF